MEALFQSEGWFVPFKPTADVSAGQVVVQGDLVGVAIAPIPANTTGSLGVRGLYSMRKGASALAAGAIVYWDNTNKVVTTTSTGNKQVGKVVQAAVASDTYALVLLTQ